MTKKYNLLKAASWYMIGNLLVKGVSFFLLPIFTDLMSTRDYGIFSVYSSYLVLFETLILLGMSATVRIAKYSDDVNFEEYISTIIKIPVILTGMIMILINIYFIWFDELLSMGVMLWNCLLITAAFASIINIISARLSIDGNYIAYMVYSIGNALLNIGLSLLLCYTVYRFHDIYMARVIGGMIPSIAFGIGYCVIFVKRYKLRVPVLKHALRLGVPLLFHTAATVILTQSDRILIKYLDGYEHTGIYSIAVTITAIPMVLLSSLENAWAPWFYERLNKKDYSSIRKINDDYIILFGIVIVEFMIISPEIIRFFTAQAYWDSIYSLIPLSMCIFAEMLYSMTVNIEYFNKKTWMITHGTVIAVVLNIILDVIFIKLFGYIGAAYGTVISKFALFFIHWVFSRKIDKNAIFGAKYAVGAIILLIALNCTLLLLVNNIIARYILFLVIAVVGVLWLFKNKNEFLEIMKK